MHKLIHRLHNPNVGILLLRLALGAVFINAGWMKVTNMAGTIEGFAGMGFSTWITYVVSYAELLGGIALILGLFVRYFGLLLAVIMLVATYVTFGGGFKSFQLPLVLTLVSSALITLGAGIYSIDHLCCARKNKKK